MSPYMKPMTSSNVFTLLALLRTITDGGRKTLVGCAYDESTVFSLMLKQLINDLYILEVSKNGKDKENLKHVLHLYNKIYDPVKNEKNNLSIREFAIILSKLSFNFSQFFLWQDRLIKFYKWKDNKKTVFYLLIASLFLYKPILIIAIPLIYLIYFYLFDKKIYDENVAEKVLQKKKYLNLNLEPNVIYFIEFIFNLTDLQNMLNYITLCSEKIENFLKNKSQASESLATVVLYLILVLTLGCSKFFIIQLWYHFLKKKISIMTTSEEPPLEKKKKSFTSSLINEIVKKEEYMKVYEIQMLKDQSWEVVVYTKNIEFEPKRLGSTKLSLNIKGYISLDNIKPKNGSKFKANSKWTVESNEWALNEDFNLNHNIFTFTHKYSEPDNLKEYVYLKNTNYRIKRLTKKVITNMEPHQDHSY